MQQLQQERRRRQIMIIVPTVIALVAVGILVYIRFSPVEGIAEFGSQDRGHDVAAEFDDTGLPPVGGTHDPRWQNCGIYTAAIANGPAVHSLEHGAVWITYHPDLPAEEVAVLQQFVQNKVGGYLLLSPYPGQKSDVVATAWGVQLEVDTASDERIEEFVDRYRGGGPEPGAPCSGGIDATVQ